MWVLPVPAPATTTTLPSAPMARCCSPVSTTTSPCDLAEGLGGWLLGLDPLGSPQGVVGVPYPLAREERLCCSLPVDGELQVRVRRASRALVVNEDQPLQCAVHPVHPAYDLKSLPLSGEAGLHLRDLGLGQREVLSSNCPLELCQVDLPPVDPAPHPPHLQLPLRFLEGCLQVL